MASLFKRVNQGYVNYDLEAQKDIVRKLYKFVAQEKQPNIEPKLLDSITKFNIEKYFDDFRDDVQGVIDDYLAGKRMTNSGRMILSFNLLVNYIKNFARSAGINQKERASLQDKFDSIKPLIQQVVDIATKEEFNDLVQLLALYDNVSGYNYNEIKLSPEVAKAYADKIANYEKPETIDEYIIKIENLFDYIYQKERAYTDESGEVKYTTKSLYEESDKKVRNELDKKLQEFRTRSNKYDRAKPAEKEASRIFFRELFEELMDNKILSDYFEIEDDLDIVIDENEELDYINKVLGPADKETQDKILARSDEIFSKLRRDRLIEKSGSAVGSLTKDEKEELTKKALNRAIMEFERGIEVEETAGVEETKEIDDEEDDASKLKREDPELYDRALVNNLSKDDDRILKKYYPYVWDSIIRERKELGMEKSRIKEEERRRLKEERELREAEREMFGDDIPPTYEELARRRAERETLKEKSASKIQGVVKGRATRKKMTEEAFAKTRQRREAIQAEIDNFRTLYGKEPNEEELRLLTEAVNEEFSKTGKGRGRPRKGRGGLPLKGNYTPKKPVPESIKRKIVMEARKSGGRMRKGLGGMPLITNMPVVQVVSEEAKKEIITENRKSGGRKKKVEKPVLVFEVESVVEPVKEVAKKGRGRPKKVVAKVEVVKEVARRGRGRPKKVVAKVEVVKKGGKRGRPLKKKI
jgi:hypothetical protein